MTGTVELETTHSAHTAEKRLSEDPVVTVMRGPRALVSSSSAGLSPDDIAVFSTAWEEEIDGVLTPYVGQVYTGSAIHAAVGLGDAFPDDLMPGIPLVPDQYAVTYMQTVTNRLVGVGNELWEDIRNELLNGLHAGDSIEQIAARISHVAGVSQRRATTIARTEMHGAAEAGSQAQMSFMGWEPGTCTKEWVAVTDGRTRLSHSLADGQRVGVDEMFVVGGSHLKFPGDPGGAPGETINCRCTIVFNVDEPPPFRCNGALTADASSGDSSYCVVPSPTANIDAIPSQLQAAVFNAFMTWAKISPAHGGAKIHKELKSFRDAVKGNMMMSIPADTLDGVSDWDILAVVDKYYVAKKDTFSHKYTEWVQSPAGKKATGGLTPPTQATHVVTPSATAPPPVVVTPPAPIIPELPPVAPKPSPGEIKFTGKTLGSHGAQVWVNPTTGDRWLFKPQQKFMTDLDIGIAKIQSKARVTRPGMYEITLDGQHGSIQYMFESGEAWPSGSFDPLKLTAVEIATMQREQIFDWMISNFDTHSGQWIRLTDGTLFGTDKGQAFKFFGKDKLDWDYVPVTPLGSDKLTYSQMWKAFVQGKNIDLQDPTTGELGAYIEQLVAIPDDEYRALLQPYAEFREKAGIGTAKSFLDAAVARKNHLKDDFAEFWARAEKERYKHVPKPPPKVPEPTVTPTAAPAVIDAQTQANLDLMQQAIFGTPAPPTPGAPTKIGTGALGNIDDVPPYVRELVWDAWIELGDGKKVTPAWGGAKIFKMLDELHKLSDKSPTLWGDLAGLDHMQLLRIIDEQGGFKGKVKSYETVVMDWLDSPQSTNTMLKMGYTSPPPGLKKVAAVTPGPKPVIAPSTSTLTESDKAYAAIDGAVQKQTPAAFFAYANDYANDDVMGYMLDAGGDYLRAVKFTSGPNTGVRVERLSVDGKKWVTQDIHFDWNSMMSPYQDPNGLSLWSIVLPPKSTGAPTSLVGKTKIAGKAPGDEVSGLDLWESRYQWKASDVLGTTKYGNQEFRLVSDGQGNITLQAEAPGLGTWQPLKMFKHDLKTKQKAFGVANNAKWKLTGDVLESKKPSIIAGFNEGDHVTPEMIWNGTFGLQSGDTVAYAQTPQGLMKIYFDTYTGNLTYAAQTSEHSWTVLGEFHTKDHFTFGIQQYDWYAASKYGKIPDTLKAGTPGKTVPGVKPASNVPGKLEGEEMTPEDFIAFYDSSPPPGTVAAHGINGLSGTQYRIVYDIDDSMHIEVKLKGAKTWQEYETVSDVHDIMDVQVKWKASADTFTPAAPTPIKTNPLGDTLATSADVWQHYGSLGDVYESGDVIATRQTNGWQPIKERLVYQDGYVVKQTQTAAGSWTKTSVLTQQWQLSSTYTKWTVEAPGTKITKAQQTAIKKHISKTALPPPSAAGGQGVVTTAKATKKAAKKAAPTKAPKQGPATPASVPVPAQPFNMVPVDLTPWDDVERELIFQYFRTNHHVYTSSSPEQIWAALQATKYHFQTSQGGKYLNLNEIEILRILDERSSLKHGVTDTHPFEAKIVNWLKTPQGKAYVNKKIDAPIAATDVPIPMEDLGAGGPLDQQSYKFVTKAESLKNREDSHKKYGGWKPGEKAALKKYTGGSYTSWNDAIRRGDLGVYRADILAAQRGMRPSVRPMILHRRVGFAELNDPGITSYETLLPYVGRTYVNRGFNSSSFGTSGTWHGQLHIEIECPIGTPMSHAQDYSNFSSENEVTLAAHLIYEIISVKKVSGTTVMRVRVIGVAK